MAYQGRYHNDPTPAPSRQSNSTKRSVLLAVVLTVVIIFLLEAIAALCLVKMAPTIITKFLESKAGLVTQAEFVEKDTTDQDLSALIGNLEEIDPTISVGKDEESQTTVENVTAPASTGSEVADYGRSGRVVNILVVGQDYREGEEAHKLSDTIMLLTLNKETRTLTMTSFLRDSYVKLPEYYRGHTCGWNRINTSYALGYSWYGDAGAMEMLNLTLANNYGVNADGTVEVGFETFKAVVDAVGGVDIDLQGDEYTIMCQRVAEWGYWDVELKEGLNTLNGKTALLYARERHANNADNDMNRAERQRKILTQIITKCAQMSLTDLNAMIDQILPQVITNISAEDIAMYVTELTPYLLDLKFESNQCPADGTYKGEIVELPDGPGGVLKIDFEANKKIMAAIVNGESVEE